MTYDAKERSFQDGAPVELYKFMRGDREWRYTSADADVVFGINTYAARTLKRGAIEATQESARSAIKIQCSRDFEIADMFRVTAPTDVIAVIITRYHRGDAGAAVIWTGRVLNVDWSGAEASLNCEPASTSLKRTGLRRLYGKQCPHVLFSPQPGCGADKDSHKIETAVTAVSGAVISVAALLDRPYAGGWAEIDMGEGGVERRFIREFAGLNLTLTLPFRGLSIGAVITVYPGCDHTMTTCNDVYANLENNGGFPYTPTKNPFDGTPVY